MKEKKELLSLLGAYPLLTPSEYTDKKSCQRFRERQIEWAINFEAKLTDGCVCKEELQKLLQSKNLAYKTMEKGYIQLAKKLAKLQKLTQDLQYKIDRINKNIVGGLQEDAHLEGKRDAYVQIKKRLEKITK